MKKMEIGTIIEYTLPKSIEIGLNGSVKESNIKDITYYQIEGYNKKHSKFGYDYLEYKVFDLTKSKYTTLDEMLICCCLKKGNMKIMKED